MIIATLNIQANVINNGIVPPIYRTNLKKLQKKTHALYIATKTKIQLTLELQTITNTLLFDVCALFRRLKTNLTRTITVYELLTCLQYNMDKETPVGTRPVHRWSRLTSDSSGLGQ